MWKLLYKDLEIVVPEGYRPVAKPTKGDLDSFENEVGLKLPRSYREFMQQFGPGTLAEYFRIYDPVRIRGEISRKKKVEETLIAYFGRPEFIRRLVPFASTFGSDGFDWDPSDVQPNGSDEYSIWIFNRLEQGLELLTNSFTEFVNEVCLGHGFDKYGGKGEIRLPRFEPFVTRE